ncbi:hypothetical protein DHW03_16315 [Pedobacter yonginense]|uniref:Uncharacterized protein n=1 Tax=Pedobacter yonginense TaxID=651869 RepID=A0A317EIE1_9SPHI|nr:outer membrane beta-barrel protein [Pedobacter yonginense]PWS26344.1 hypothetical protein DHW03_16315 [Pedobacter yonginense]
MKKILLSLITVAGLAYGANAQTEKGKVIVGGNLTLWSAKTTSAQKADVTFNLVPSVGYFVSNDLALGTGVGYMSQKMVSALTLKNGFEVSPFARHYVKLNDQFKFFAELGVPMVFGKQKTVAANGDVQAKVADLTMVGVKLAPGFAFFPNKKVAIEVSVDGIGYQHEGMKSVAGVKTSTNSFGINVDTFMPKLGLMFHF